MEEASMTTDTLEELQLELERIVSAEKKKRQEKEEADKRYLDVVAPVLYRLRDYLNQLLKLLNDPRLQQSEKTRHLCMPKVNYNLAQIGVSAFGLLEGRQGNYTIITSNQEGRLADFSLYYQCIPERPVEIQYVEFRKPNEYKRRLDIQERLKKYGLKHSCAERACNDSSIKMLFTLQPVVSVKYEFVGNPDGKSFSVTITNAGGVGPTGLLGTICFPCLTPDQVGVESIEALIHFIVRQKSQLFWFWEMEKSTQPAKEDVEITPGANWVSYPAVGEPLKEQTYDFSLLKVMNVLSKIQKQNSNITQAVKKSHQEQSQQTKKLDKVQETLEEHHKRTQAEHDKFMAELAKIGSAIEKGQAENRTLLGWVTTLLFSKHNKRDGW